MTWESGPALPPGTLVLDPEQAQALLTAVRAIGVAFERLGAALAETLPAVAETIAAAGVRPDPAPDLDSTVHLRVLPETRGRP